MLLKNRVADIHGSGNSLNNLWAAAQQAWGSINTDEEVAKHTSTMDAQVKAVKAAKGYQTGF
jgi:hypothetical protein